MVRGRAIHALMLAVDAATVISVVLVGKNPSELFGKFTWKIENFSETSKRELRSHQFDVGEYKWCVQSHQMYAVGCLTVPYVGDGPRSVGTSSSTPRVAMSATTYRYSYA